MNSNTMTGRVTIHLQPTAVIQPVPKVRAMQPAAAVSMVVPNNPNKRSYLALVLVVLAHAIAIAALVYVSNSVPLEKIMPAPMMVSLINAPAPEPEVVPLLPEPPKPQPVIKKQKQQPKPKDIKPTPQPIEQTSPVAEQAVVPTPPAPAVPIEVAKAPEVKPEPEKPQVKQDVIEEPKFGAAYLYNPPPKYPPMSNRIGEQGRVIMRVLVSANGDAESVKVETSSGSTRLDEAAIEAVKKWRFVPAKKNNQPMSAYVLVPMNFSIERN